VRRVSFHWLSFREAFRNSQAKSLQLRQEFTTMAVFLHIHHFSVTYLSHLVFLAPVFFPSKSFLDDGSHACRRFTK
jgi:hypothetical protein